MALNPRGRGMKKVNKKVYSFVDFEPSNRQNKNIYREIKLLHAEEEDQNTLRGSPEK
jgi:hypothetical protein